MFSPILAALLLPFAQAPAAETAEEAAEVPPVSSEEVEALLERLTPDEDEPWRTIPWRIDLLAAQREAIATERPLFIWAMDGHPLGCT